MNSTITVTMPDELKQSLQEQVVAGRFRSLSAVVRKAAKQYVHLAQKITDNNLPAWFEDITLESAKEPVNIVESGMVKSPLFNL